MSDLAHSDESFEAIVRDTQPHIRAYIAGMGVPRHDVDDIAQDVYVELYRFFDRIPPEVTPKQWLKGIARNLFPAGRAGWSAGPGRRAGPPGAGRVLRQAGPGKPPDARPPLRAGAAEPDDRPAAWDVAGGGAGGAVPNQGDFEGLYW
jgi:hypothetical protein